MIRAFLEKVGLLPKRGGAAQTASLGTRAPRIISRKEHGISRKGISENALKVLYRLHKQGFQAYLVGGGVRDLLLGLHPKDFDIATNATPEQIRKIFRNCRLIGRRFRLAHIYFGHDIVEVATFRGAVDEPTDAHSHSEHGLILRDNVYGTLATDVWRRDFTINALYYNIADFSVVDFTNGYNDLKAKKMRMIGDARVRYREDPVRMLRAIRFASKVNFTLDNELTQPILELKSLLGHVSPARLFEEIIKMFHSGVAYSAYENLKKYHLFEELFPDTFACLQNSALPTHALLTYVFQNTDLRISQYKPVTPTFFIAALLWHPILLRTQQLLQDGLAFLPARHQAIEDLLQSQAKRLSFPKRLAQGAKEIWIMQTRLERRNPKRIEMLIHEPRFRAAYDFLELRAKAGEDIKEIAHWWQSYIDGNVHNRNTLLKMLSGTKKRKKKPRKKPQQPAESI